MYNFSRFFFLSERQILEKEAETHSDLSFDGSYPKQPKQLELKLTWRQEPKAFSRLFMWVFEDLSHTELPSQATCREHDLKWSPDTHRCPYRMSAPSGGILACWATALAHWATVLLFFSCLILHYLEPCSLWIEVKISLKNCKCISLACRILCLHIVKLASYW